MSSKNHKMVDGKLLQMNKQYKALKMKQKEKIGTWINEEITQYYRDNADWPRKEEEFYKILDKLYERIEAAGIWIPYGEVCEHFMGKRISRIKKLQVAIDKVAIEQHEIQE